MQTLPKLAQGTLRWVQPEALAGRWELRAGDDPVGGLELRSPSGALAVARLGDEEWSFRRSGFWRSHATVHPRDSSEEIAEFRGESWSAGGTLALADGTAFHATTSHWGTRWELRDDDDQPLIRFTYRGAIHLGSEVTVEPRAEELPDLPLLVLFGWYLAVMLYHDETWQVPQV